MSAFEELCHRYPSVEPAVIYAVLEELRTSTADAFDIEEAHRAIRGMVLASEGAAFAWMDAAGQAIGRASVRQLNW
jgi:hypothetical protein